MGILNLPRIYFGGHFHWNPSTFNNNDYINTYNPFHVELNRSWLENQGVHTKEQFRKWAIQAQNVGNKTISPPAEWNFHGGMQAAFLSETSPTIENSDFSRPDGGTLTHGFTKLDGSYIDGNDPWLAQQVQFNAQTVPGKLVDVDPTCFWSSQYFADTFQLGNAAAGEGFSAPVGIPSHSRWINLSRNYNTTGEIIIAGGISCVWQTAFSKEDINWFNANPAAGSFQAELQSQLEDATVKGLMVRWVTYDTVYFQGSVFEGIPAGNTNLRMERVARIFQQYADEMAAYQAGKTNKKPDTPINRAYSKAIGWIGLWNSDELATMPVGRTLLAGTTAVAASGLPASYYQGFSEGSSKSQVFIAPTEVEVAYDGDEVTRITLDMGSTMPEVQIDGEKADFGQLQLMYGTSATELGTALANLPNDRAEYLRTSGVVDLYPSDFLCNIQRSDIEFTQLGLSVEAYTPPSKDGPGGTARTTALVEAPLIANTDHRGVYVNQPDPQWDENAADPTFTVQVRYYGQLPQTDGEFKIGFGQYAPSPLMVSSGNWNIVKENSKVLQDPFVKVYQPIENARDRVIGHSTVLDVPAGGELTLAAIALRPGFGNFAFYPLTSEAADSWKGAPAQVVAPFISQAFYTVIRALPFKNLAAVDFENWLKSRPDTQHLPDVSLVNQRVFDEVFGLFYRLYPVMDFISNPTKWQEWRGRIMAVTDPALFDSATYMPVTRNLSAGNRRILELWDTYLDGIQVGSAHNKALKKRDQIR